MTENEAKYYLLEHKPIIGFKTHNEALDVAINALSEIQQYRDAKEQGLLLRLPCKAGDTVWCIFEGKVYKGKAERFAYWHDTIDGDYVNIDVTYNIIDPFYADERLMRRCDTKRYGKRVFLTRGEAEQALAEIKGV